jgi:hypothetical protein
MLDATVRHFRRTSQLAKSLKRREVFNWLVSIGYFPEPYVFPPCFKVTKHPPFGSKHFRHSRSTFNPTIGQVREIQFPKNELSDRVFGIYPPEHNSDIAYTIARNWKAVVAIMFDRNKVCSYSFPIPLDSNHPGTVGKLRSGRMIYEFIEMAENDLASIAFKYKFLFKTDVKNFYPSIYTHGIAWAIHGKKRIRKARNRHNFGLFGNRLDKLAQCANDGCTNGIPIGPAVSDVLSEIVLAAVDRQLSRSLNNTVVVVRFKDDYRILAKSEADGKKVIKQLQSSLRQYKLELNEEKTDMSRLPGGLFRAWVSQYHAVNPNPQRNYSFKRFKEVYLSVVTIDNANPNTGIIDRFLVDLTTKSYKLRVRLNRKTAPKVISLLLILGGLKTKAFPRVLAISEALLKTPVDSTLKESVANHIKEFMDDLIANESENIYLLLWLIYFIRANGLESSLKKPYKLSEGFHKMALTSRATLYKSSKGFRLFEGVKASAKSVSLLKHLDLFCKS